MKKFNQQYNVGSSKYVVNYYNGERKHKDGSELWDIAIFKNIPAKKAFISQLVSEGYVDLDAGGDSLKVGSVVYHKEHKTIGIVREVLDRGEVRTDADGVVNVSDLEVYDKSNPTHKSAHIAPSTKEEIGDKYAHGGNIPGEKGFCYTIGGL